MTNMNFSFFGPSLAESLPTPKMTGADRVSVHSWFKEYAAFSERFALCAIEALKETEQDVVFDPFLGSGTSLVAAAKMNLPFIGSELSPFSALLSRTKVSFKAEETLVQRMLRCPDTCPEANFGIALSETFPETDLQYAQNVFLNIAEDSTSTFDSLLSNLISKNEPAYDSYRVAFVSVILSARDRSSLSKGSNPVWFRTSRNVMSEDGTSLCARAEKFAGEMLRALSQESTLARGINVICGDSRHLPFQSPMFDILLTSPPYLNRLDYVVNQLPELLMLSLLSPQNIDNLRRTMIGTTKMVEKGEPDSNWGETCLDILERIKMHPSRASSTYYIWNYYKYFKDMFEIFKELRRVARKGARGILVVQNSHYKEIKIPVTEIFREMGSGVGIEIEEVMRVPVKTHMGKLCPKQRSYDTNKTLSEAVLSLSFQ